MFATRACARSSISVTPKCPPFDEVAPDPGTYRRDHRQPGAFPPRARGPDARRGLPLYRAPQNFLGMYRLVSELKRTQQARCLCTRARGKRRGAGGLSAPFPRPAQYLSLAGVDAIKATMFPHWHRRSVRPPRRRSVPGTDRLCLKHQHHQAIAAPGHHSLSISGKAREAAWRRARSRRPAGRRASCIRAEKIHPARAAKSRL